MARAQLDENEQWLLMYLNEHCKGTDARSAMGLLKKDWEHLEPSRQVVAPVIERMDWEAFHAAVTYLSDLELVHGQWTRAGVFVHVTGEGRRVVRNIEHPDLVDQYLDRARRHPVRARLILYHTILGPILGYVALVLSLYNLFGD
ncbi:MAG: hypothetical protein ACYTG0_34080 [Planctomycetota bacterium]|jgi:hypothetical protein